MVKKLVRLITLVIVPFLASILIRLLYFTNKKEFHSPDSIPEEPTVFACWHGELLMFYYFYAKYRKIPKVKALISSHFDGLLISRTMRFFGVETISGSTNRNAVKVLMQGIKTLKSGYDMGITPDGPKGPRHEVADGMIIMAQKTGSKIVLAEIKPTKYWQLGSWDKFIIPKPFGTIHYYSSGAIDISNMSADDARELIKNELKKH